MVIGIAIFRSLTAVMTSLVLEPTMDAKDPILIKLEKLEKEMAALTAQISALSTKAKSDASN
jgi:hypothetical protein